MPDVNLETQLAARLRSLGENGVEWLAPAPDLSVVAKQPDLFVAAEPPAGALPDTPEGRRVALDVLAGVVRECQRCPELAATRTQTVFGVGPVGAEILFVGEAPGADEDRQGIPFVGAAGQLLNKIIAASGLKREDVYICNILRCRPPANRQPKPDECQNCHEYLEKTITLVAPKMIVCWGAVAAQNLLQTKTGITRLRGQFYEYNGIPVLCTFHPAMLLEGRAPEKKKDVWEDMKTMLTKLGKPLPATKTQG